MAIKKEKKTALLQEYGAELAGAKAIFLANYTGLTVGQMEQVRKSLRQEHTDLEVLRNALFAIAAKQVGQEAVASALQGATLAIFCKGDPTSPAKSLANLSREMEGLKVYGGALGTRLLTAEDVAALANLPEREVLLAQVLGGLQAPISGFVGVLSGVLRSFLYVLKARTDQLQGLASTEAA